MAVVFTPYGRLACSLLLPTGNCFDYSGVPATYCPAPGVMVDNLLGDQVQSPVQMLLGSPISKHEWQVSL